MKPRYGIKVPMAVDDYVWVTQDSNNKLGLKPLLFKSHSEAVEHAEIWGPLAKVVEYSKYEVDNQM